MSILIYFLKFKKDIFYNIVNYYILSFVGILYIKKNWDFKINVVGKKGEKVMNKYIN